MSKPDHDMMIAISERHSDEAGPAPLSLVACGVTFVQFFLPLQEQKIPDESLPISPWRWSIRAAAC